jgi:endoglycosylceramidase
VRALVLAIALIALTAAPAAALPPLQVQTGEDPAIVDDGGREVLLRGVNVNQLNDYFQADPSLPTTAPLTEQDFARIRALGFDVVRLAFNWSSFQPARDTFDPGALARVRQAVRWAGAHGLYVVLDLHQDAWGKFIATPAGESCAPGMERAVGWDGAPRWATLTDGLPTCRVRARELSPAVAQAFTSFYTDREGIQTQLLHTWERIARELAGEPNVAGYDLMNEPHVGFAAGVSEATLLGRYYAAAIEAVRAGERAAGAPRRIAFFEPSVAWSGFGVDTVPPPGFTSDDQIVFAPHLYLESISIDQQAGISSLSIEQGFEAAERVARLYGAPLWSGEWGWFGDPAEHRAKLERYAAQEDARAVGGAWWVWKQACGDPHVAGYPGASGSLNPTTCPQGEQLPLVTGYTDVLRRAYPRAAPGRITALRSDHAAGTFTVEGRAGAARRCRLEVWVPSARVAMRASGVRRLRRRRVPGGTLVTGCARGAYRLSGGPVRRRR